MYERTPKHYLVVCRIRVTKDFLWTYDLDFGNLSFQDQYTGKDANVKNLISWINYWNNQYKKSKFKYIAKPIKISINKVLPILKTLDKFLVVHFEDEIR